MLESSDKLDMSSEKVDKNSDSDFHHPITCYICLDTYSMKKKPLILVCGHTFCEVCLQNLFDTSNEIQCCFCKVITKLDKFDDMIVNYAILSLAEQSGNEKAAKNPKGANYNTFLNVTNTHTCTCGKNSNDKKNPEFVEKLLQCVDCKQIVCPNCENGEIINTRHKNHKLTNLADFISNEADSLSDFLKNYRDLANKMAILTKKVDKFEIEKLIKSEKENLGSFFRELKNLIDKNQEIMLHTLDKLLKDTFKAIDSFKREGKYFNSDSSRYCSIVEELCNFKNITCKQKSKILNIYNINATFEEISEFNKDVDQKISRLSTPETFMKKFTKLMKSCELYKNKMMTFHNLILKKGTNLVEKGFESKIKFYMRNNH